MSIEAIKLALEALEAIPEEIEGWLPDKCTDAVIALRQAIEQAQKQEPVAMPRFGLNPDNGMMYESERGPWCLYKDVPPQRQPLTDAQAYDMGAKGGEPTEAERLLFEAWMRGHCWAVVGEWDGKTYVHKQESTGFVNASAMNTRQLWAAWRDRAALEAAHGIKGEV
jgi:hypothetical protein